MKRPAGEWDGAQPRTHILEVLTRHDVKIIPDGDDYYVLVDSDGDEVVLHLPNPVPRAMLQILYRRFGHHGFHITDLRAPGRR